MNPGWLPTKAQMDLAIAEQRRQRERLAQRVDDGPLTILAPIDKPARKYPEFVDSFPPAEEDNTTAPFIRGFVSGLLLAGITSVIVLLTMLKVPA